MTTSTAQMENLFAKLMRGLMAKSKDELKEMCFNPDYPQEIADLIKQHPALLGNDYVESPSSEHEMFVATTESIIKAHGFHTQEWEWTCDKEHNPVCLHIWIGRRTKKNIRELILTDEQKKQIRVHLGKTTKSLE